MERQTGQENKRDIILDIEANGLRPTKIWCIVCKDIKTKEIFRFRPNAPKTGHEDFKKEFLDFLETCDKIIGHNLLGYDIYWLNKLLGIDIKIGRVIDTLVLSRLFRPVTPFKEQLKKFKGDNRLGGHSLDAWGRRLGFAKIEFNDWEKFSEEMLEYCVRDVELNYLVYLELLKEQDRQDFSTYSIRLEHKVAWLLSQQERNGFFLDQEKAKQMLAETTVLLDKMTHTLREMFPPSPKLVREKYVVKYNKDGTMSAVSRRILDQYESDPELVLEKVDLDVYNLYELQEFNPKSSKQIAERLLSLDWEPKKFTDKGNPKTDKETLQEAIEDVLKIHPDLNELKSLADYNIIADRQQKAAKWLELVENDGRVHGSVNPIGAGTHRCSHYNDNMANIARVVHDSEGNVLKGLEGKFGWDSRQCWSVPSADHVLVGADASGIQLRALAHYMNDPEYTKKLLEDDIHTVHQIAAGIDTRNKAKTFIYAWLLGAGDEKIGSIVEVDEAEFSDLFQWAKKRKIRNVYDIYNPNAQNLKSYIIDGLRRKGRKATRRTVATIIKGFKVKEQFLNRTLALKKLKTEDIPEATNKGYLKGLDGRQLWIPNEHLAMSLYLQGFEAVIMKLAMCLYHDELNAKGIPFKQVAFVHDEFQIETLKEYGDVVGQAVVDAIKKAGELLGSNCPLDGEYKIGKNWATTH